jgi:integrase
MLRGMYVDVTRGRETFREYTTRWLAAQTFDPSTREPVELRLRLHAYPVLGAKRLCDIRPSTVQTWLRGLEPLAASYRRVVFANVSAVFRAAVDDEVPCRAPSVRPPTADARKVTVWSAEQVLAVRDALPERYRVVATLAAGLGLRQGEIFGLSPNDVDFLRGRVDVRRQVKLFSDGSMVFARRTRAKCAARGIDP